MVFLNQFIRKLKPYNSAGQQAWKHTKNSPLKLDWNEATIPPSPRVTNALQQHIATENLNWYPQLDNHELRSALANYCQVSVSEVDYYPSSDALHEQILRGFTQSDDTLLIVRPTYDNFRAAAESFGINIRYMDIPLDTCRLDTETLSQAIEKEAPKLVYLCSPNNPLGYTLHTQETQNLLSKYPQTLFIIDEAYIEFSQLDTPNHNATPPLVSQYNNLIITRTFSKAFALASLRIGYIIASEKLITDLRSFKNPKNTCMAAQIAATAALKDLPYTLAYAREVARAKELFKHYLLAHDYKIVGGDNGNFLLIDFGTMREIITQALAQNYIFIRTYDSNNSLRHLVRISIGTRQQMENVIKHINTARNTPSMAHIQ